MVWPLHHSQKHAKMNYDPRHSNKIRRPYSLPVNFGIDVPKLYMSTGLQLMPLSASSQISLSRRPPGTESLSYLCREQECRNWDSRPSTIEATKENWCSRIKFLKALSFVKFLESLEVSAGFFNSLSSSSFLSLQSPKSFQVFCPKKSEITW